MNSLQRYSLTALCFLMMSSVHADVSVALEVNSHVEAEKGSKNTPADSHAVLNVTLAENYFVVNSAQQTSVYDFDKRRRVVIDHLTKTRVEYSLYDTVGFRVLELRNRISIDKVLAAAKIDQQAKGPVDNEHALSIQDKSSPALQVTTKGDEEVFSSSSGVLFRRSLRGSSVSPKEAIMFAQFMRYVYGGHPQILAALAKNQTIASQFELVTRQAGVSTHRFVVKSVQPLHEKPLDLMAFPLRPVSASTDPVDRVLDQAALMTNAECVLARQRSKTELVAAWREARLLDAYLGSIEWALMTGEGIAPLTPEQKALLSSDPAVKKLGEALSHKTKESLPSAIKVFQELQLAAPAKAHVLKIFEANHRAMLGDPVARQLFLEVLTINPCIAGVYKDLGDSLIGSFDMPRAWRSWDLGRQMAPQFPTFGAVNEFERSLVAHQTDFF
jgi:hypothetical protein